MKTLNQLLHVADPVVMQSEPKRSFRLKHVSCMSPSLVLRLGPNCQQVYCEDSASNRRQMLLLGMFRSLRQRSQAKYLHICQRNLARASRSSSSGGFCVERCDKETASANPDCCC